jgi:hypothetical protein
MDLLCGSERGGTLRKTATRFRRSDAPRSGSEDRGGGFGNGKGRKRLALPARVVSTKIRHLLVISSIPARGFSAAVSVFRGTPPAKPLDCKIGFVVAGDALASARRFWLGRGHHQDVAAYRVMVRVSFLGQGRSRLIQERKNPASGGGSRVGVNPCPGSPVTCLPPRLRPLPYRDGLPFRTSTAWRRTNLPDPDRRIRSRERPASGARSGLSCSSRFSSKCRSM